MTKFDVNSDEAVKFSNNLEKLHQSAFPNAVRGTLSGMAFDVKKDTMPKTSSEFTNRNKTFFKANSRVLPARGFNVNSMESLVGFIPNNNTKNNKAVEELEQQEHGGIIKDRELIPLKQARISGKNDRKISTKNRLSKLNARKIKQSTKKTFVKDVNNAGKLGYIRTKKSILQITSINKNKFKFKRIYMINNSKSVRIDKPTSFMERASVISGSKGNEIYIKEAQRQFERYYNS